MTNSLAEAGSRDGGHASEEAYLRLLGNRVREMRARRGMSRKILSRDSGVSERYLGELESGRGNISILLLRQLAAALDAPIEELVRDGPDRPVELAQAVEVLRRLAPHELEVAHRLLADRFAAAPADSRSRRIALIGLRGAGKSTLGQLLAAELQVPFVELDKEVEAQAGAPLAAIFDLYGQAGFRRLERRCLEAVLSRHPDAVIATGGGIVSDSATFERLRSACFTIWLKASPVEHMQRVMAQGDMRPMADNREAMADLQEILRTREPLYSQADAQLDTAGEDVAESLQALASLVPESFKPAQ